MLIKTWMPTADCSIGPVVNGLSRLQHCTFILSGAFKYQPSPLQEEIQRLSNGTNPSP